eukprot:scaffold63892_cov25-Prasinocladus_malaysianus.AAC.1
MPPAPTRGGRLYWSTGRSRRRRTVQQRSASASLTRLRQSTTSLARSVQPPATSYTVETKQTIHMLWGLIYATL